MHHKRNRPTRQHGAPKDLRWRHARAVLAAWLCMVSVVGAQSPMPVRPSPVDTAPLTSEQAEMARQWRQAPRRAAVAAAASGDPCVGQSTGPCAFARADVSAVRVASPITARSSDGQGGDLAYSGGAVGVSEDGRRLFVACGPPRRGVATLILPADGGAATWAAPCSGPDENEIKRIIPGWGAGEPRLGGVTEADGVVTVSAYGTYDANGVAEASHWAGSDLTRLAGPFKGTVAPGMVKGNMGTIPVAWRTMLGGPAFATAGYTSIISRASYGTAFSVFDPAAVTTHGFAMRMLLGCPHSQLSCRTWTAWGPSSDGFEGAELDGGTFIVPGTRTLVAIEREARGAVPGPGVAGAQVPHDCYGYRTDDATKHGTPWPSPEGVRACWSPYDPLNQKGNKGGTYRLVAKLYDLADLVAVRQGAMQPWDIKQYATIDLPGSSPAEYVSGGAYNPVTDEFYLVRFLGGATSTIWRYTGFRQASAPTAPAVTIAASTASVVHGQSVTLTGTIAGASGGTVTPLVGSVTGPTWTATVTPTTSTTFVVAATNAAGTSTATVAVAVTPPPEQCGDGLDNDGDGLIDENCAVDCVETSGAWGPGPDPPGWSAWSWDGSSAVETRFRERTWTQTTAAAYGGEACTWTTGGLDSTAVERQTDTRPYDPPPPPAFIGRVRSQATFTAAGAVAGIRVTLQVPASMLATVPARGAAVTLSLPLLDGSIERRTGTVYRVTPNYGYAGAPTDAQVVVEFRAMSAIALRLEVP